MLFALLLAVGAAVYPAADWTSGADVRAFTFSDRCAYGAGFVRDGDEAVCENDDRRAQRGAHWDYVAAGDGTAAFEFSAESRAERVAGRKASIDYSVFIDIDYRDGSHAYGLNAPFEPEPADVWQRKSVRVVPDKPIRSASCYLLFRNQTGKVRFRAPTLSVADDGRAMLDACCIDIGSMKPLAAPGFLLRDAAANGGYRSVENGGTEQGVRFGVRRRTEGTAEHFDVALKELTGRDRATTLVYAIPFPSAAKVVWHGNPRQSEDLSRARGQRRATTEVGAGEGTLSTWPFAAVTVDGKGFALGIDPAAPALFRAAYSADLHTLYIAFDVGFASEHPKARFRFVSFGFPGEQGFRGALAEYQRILPTFSEVRFRRHGLWMAFQKISEVRGWEDFGFAFKEGDNEPEWDKAHGIVTFRYTEPTSWWMSMKKGAAVTMEECLAEANARAAKGDPWGRAWQASACHDRNGRPVGEVKSTPWCKGALWFMNPLPGIAGGEYELKVGTPRENTDGEYIDSAEFHSAPALDYRRENFAAAKTPLAFDPATKRPGLAKCLTTFEYVRAAANRCHDAGRYLMGNCIPCTWPWLVAYSDFGGREVRWIDAHGKWKPASHEELLYARAMSGGKPYCFLMNANFDRFTHEHVEKYMQLCVAYGLFASFFSPNASDGHYFSRPELYERDRDLFRKYVPICRRISEAGWRPVNTLARAETGNVLVEQFGDRFLTVYNAGKTPVSAVLRAADGGTFDAAEFVAGAPWRFAAGTATAEIPPETVRVLEFPDRRVLTDEPMRTRFARFAADDEELYTNACSNAEVFDVMRRLVPRFECPDADITDTYYFRWWTYRKHLKRTARGWIVTEFLPPVGWAGYGNAIICPAGHHVMEGRWLSDPRYVDGCVRFWSGTDEGREVRKRYSSWIAFAALEAAKVRGDLSMPLARLDDLVGFYRDWETNAVPYRQCAQPDGVNGIFPMGGDGKGMFTSLDNHEGSEYTLSGDGYRPLFNAAMYGEATAIAEIAAAAGRKDLSAEFAAKADVLACGIRERLWNRERQFFVTVKTNGVQTAVRELHGYAPWYFGVPLEGYGAAWAPLMRSDGFLAKWGLTFPEQSAPGFKIAYEGHECQWNGPSWPYATSIALTALIRALQGESAAALPVGREDFARLLHQYAAAQVLVRPDGRTVKWIDENLNPFTGDWISRTVIERTPKMKARFPRERGKDYNHSTFCDLVITGLCGLRPRFGDGVDVKPLAPAAWDWWCLDGVRYHGHTLTILFDRDGSRYGRGKGLVVLEDGVRKEIR